METIECWETNSMLFYGGILSNGPRIIFLNFSNKSKIKDLGVLLFSYELHQLLQS